MQALIGVVFEQQNLYERMSGRDNLAFFAQLFGAPKQRVDEVLDMVGLKERAKDKAKIYSNGMKQRLIISAALLHEPRVVVVDEPMVGLDPAAIRMVKDILKGLAREGTTIFMSTHTLSVAEDLCDRIGIIHKGSLIATGTTRELKRLAGVQEADLEAVFLRLTEEQGLP